MDITVVMDGASYRVSAENKDSIRKIPQEHRQQLIATLEAVKKEHRIAEETINRATEKVSAPVNYAAGTDFMETKPERLGEGDISDLMSRLVMEEQQNKKQGLTRKAIYKWAFGLIVAIAVITFLF